MLNLELLPPQALASGPTPCQRARDFDAHVQATSERSTTALRRGGPLPRRAPQPKRLPRRRHRRLAPPAGPSDRLKHQTPPDGDGMKLAPCRTTARPASSSPRPRATPLEPAYESGAPLPDGDTLNIISIHGPRRTPCVWRKVCRGRWLKTEGPQREVTARVLDVARFGRVPLEAPDLRWTIGRLPESSDRPYSFRIGP